MRKTIHSKVVLRIATSVACIAGVCIASSAFATSETLGTMASTMTNTFSSVGKLVTAASSITAIQQFKQHKDNPSQTPIGKPIGLVFIGAALLFLPTVFSVVGNTLF